jgi:DNA repair protein SbcD/Mre11
MRGLPAAALYHGRAMRFLHTADWHVGKTLKGRSRLAEQEQVLREIVGIARAHEVDAVLVAGDLYDTAAPTADAQKLVNRTLLGLAQDGVEVIAIAGNHDHAATIDAYRGFAKAAGITLVGTVRTAGNGGLVEFTARSTGERTTLAVLPFLSTRYAVRAAELVAGTPAQHTSAYDQQLRDILGKLTAGFRDDAVNLVMAHLTVLDGRMGGGERAAQSIFEYAVPAGIFPVDAHYVALGHLHRRQSVAASCPVHYSGAPLAVDFGEQENTPVVCVVDAAPGTPAAVTDVPIQAGRRLRTLRGTVAELSVLGEMVGDDFLRVWVREPARAGLREEVTALLPNALEVRIDPEFAAPLSVARPSPEPGRTPVELFGEYLGSRGVADQRVAELFRTLHERVTG